MGDQRDEDEQVRRDKYLASGYNDKTQLALLTRDLEYLISRVRTAEDTVNELRRRQDALEKSFNNLITRGSTLFALVVAAGVFLGWLASFISNARSAIGR